MSPTSLQTPICDLLGISVPIVQTGMGWVAVPRLTAATSEAGGLGILAAATLRLDELEADIRSIKEQTDKPFGVNLRADQEDVQARVELLIREGVRVASFAQAPREALIKTLKDAGVVTIPTVGAPRHAEKVAAWGADALIAQGHEGGGHTGPIATTLLLPRVCEMVDIPVLGAGGFKDGRGLVAALAFGASGIAMGTRFLLTRESPVADAIKAAYLEAGLTDTVVTRSIDGYPQRVIRTPTVEDLEKEGGIKRLLKAARNAFELKKLSEGSLTGLLKEGLATKQKAGLSWGQTVMAANAPMLTRASMVDGRLDIGILPTGQVVGNIEALPSVQEVIRDIMSEAAATLNKLTQTREGERQ